MFILCYVYAYVMLLGAMPYVILRILPNCGMLCNVMFWGDVISCSVVLYYVTLRCGTLRCATIHYDTLRYATLRYVTLKYATLRYVT